MNLFDISFPKEILYQNYFSSREGRKSKYSEIFPEHIALIINHIHSQFRPRLFPFHFSLKSLKKA